MYSLKQYLALQGASHKTYTAFQANHNDTFPDMPMLSYKQIDKKVGEWSGILLIVHHMCPVSCIAYTGPLADLETCPECKRSRWDIFQLVNSQGKVKVAAQHFYTIPIGPQIQAL